MSTVTMSPSGVLIWIVILLTVIERFPSFIDSQIN